jgi:type I restriction enzyme, R subunit
LQILAGRNDDASVDYTINQLRAMCGSLPLENINVAPFADEIRQLADSDAPWRTLSDDQLTKISHSIASLLRFSQAGTYTELQFENQTEQLALAFLKADTGEITRLRERIVENLNLLPISIPEVRRHSEELAALQTDAYWNTLSCPRIMHLQETFAPLMRFRNRRESGVFVRLSLPDKIQQRRWIIFGPGGEGAFVENYRAQVEALVKDLVANTPALQRLRNGGELTAEDIDAIAAALGGPDLFITEERLREAYHQPRAELADFLRHILNVAELPSREEEISKSFDEWVRRHPALTATLTATQLMFVRTLRKAVMQKAEATSIDALRKPPFAGIGDPERLFSQSELNDLFELIHSIAA